MPYTIESDKSRQLKWVVREDTDVSLTITVTLSGSPFNLSSYTFVAEVFKIGGTTPILSLTQGSGITNNGAAGTLVLALTDTQLNITPNEYYWRLRTTAPTDNVWFNGVFQVNGYLYDSSEDNSVSVALTIGGDNVAVTLTLGADTINGSGTANQIAYWTDSDTVAALTTATYPSLTELSYGKGVTSAIQTQIDGKQANATVISGNTTAANDGVYHVTASATFTDPSPTEGKGFTVFVRNGTATVGGTGYSTAGTVIKRVYHSGAWANYTGSSSISVTTTSSTTSLTPDLTLYSAFEITAQAASITINNATGASNFSIFMIRITDNGTGRLITFGAKYRGFGATLPTTTTANKTMYITCIYNSTDDLFDVTYQEEV